MRMAVSPLGVDISEKEYTKLVTRHSYGIFSTELVLPFLALGFSARAITFNLPIFAELNLRDGKKITGDDLRMGLRRPSTKIVAENIRNYLNSGGELIWQPPSIGILQKSLELGPLLVSVNTAALGDYWRHWNNGHYLVISEMNEERAKVYDPYYPVQKGVYEVSVDQLLAAITINAIRSTDYCMVVFRE